MKEQETQRNGAHQNLSRQPENRATKLSNNHYTIKKNQFHIFIQIEQKWITLSHSSSTNNYIE